MKYSSSAADTQNTLYDYGSLMHYSSTAFSSNGNPTITPRQANAVIGQRFNMSATDIQEVRSFYQCPTLGVTLPTLTTTPAGNDPSRSGIQRTLSLSRLFQLVSVFDANTTASSSWSTDSPSYRRYGALSTTYYYDRFQVTASTAGVYTFFSTGNIASCGYLYSGSFARYSPSANLMTFDDGLAGNRQFRFTFSMEADVSYSLVATTYYGRATGDYTLVVSGIAPVALVQTSEPPETTTTREY
jgi:hypothetical protein